MVDDHPDPSQLTFLNGQEVLWNTHGCASPGNARSLGHWRRVLFTL